MEERVREVFAAAGVAYVGVCLFSALLPLLEARAKSRLPTRPRSVIVCALPYYCGDFPGRNVARYAICRDYHQSAGELLGAACAGLGAAFPGHAFVPFVDASPIPEVRAARLAGLGAVGLHGQLILPGYGAYVFIGCVVTDLALAPSPPNVDSCLECGGCLRACPTGALGGGGFRRELCRSHITQKKGALTPWEEAQVRAGQMVWGCDLCLEACPLNREAAVTPLECMRSFPQPRLGLDKLGGLEQRAYGYRGRQTLERNITIVEARG